MKAEYLMIGGFLGAGKTAAVLQSARRLTAQGRRVGLIANDQSHGLADTALLAASGPIAEVHRMDCFRPARPVPTCRMDDLSP